ncbi:Rha family transcriptional regulator [Avibacterium paragallinarum]|uniref:Rha family transcriptional regulator n=1 Tax=Avibacterium paragallinarum TaxID=728 RepID=A0ABU7QLU9_AVIPA|nr:Rha family transcriptional regulator [Avibacterium paragallinarum]WAL57238.1 Rha family transcriptional regulator [Avibacterium paragallinarum]
MTEQQLENAVFAKLFHKETVAMTDSRKVAYYFGKRHDNLLRILNNLDCSKEFSQLNFKAAKYIDEQGKKRPMYLMTQDGFTLLVMGFTGKKAMQFKEAYINEFNQMKNWITSRANLKHDQRRLNDAIKFSLEQQDKDDPHAYSRENNLVYCVALGMSKKKWLAMRGLPETVDIRQFLNEQELELIDELLSENAVMIKLGLSYASRKTQLQNTALYHLRKQAA